MKEFEKDKLKELEFKSASRNTDINTYSANQKDLFFKTDFNFFKSNSGSKNSEKKAKLKVIKSFSLWKNNNNKKKLKNNNKTKEKEIVDNLYLYDKQLFEPIYSQIHKSIKDLDEEIKTSKKYLKPMKILKRQTYEYKYKKNNLFLNDIKSRNDTNLIQEKSDKSSYIKKNIFLKTFSGNLTNDIKDKIKKKVGFKNLQLTNIISNKQDNDDRFVIKSYTERGNNKNDFNDDLKVNSDEIPILKKNKNLLINPESKIISTTSLINASQINKTLTHYSNSTMQAKTQDSNSEINKKKYRIKTYYIEYEPKWYLRNKMIKPNFEKDTLLIPFFQKKIIDDQLILLFDNIKIFQSNFLTNKSLVSDFSKLPHLSKISLNVNLESSIGLMSEISYILLDEYGGGVKMFMENPLPRYNKKDAKKVHSEKKEFKTNISTFYERYIFLKECYEAYKIILNNKKNFYLNKNSFEILFQFLDRCRYSVSKVTSELNNLYKEPNKEDKKIIDRCLNKIRAINKKAMINLNRMIKRKNNSFIFNSKNFSRTRFLKKFNSKYKSKIDCHQKFSVFNSGINSFNYKGLKKLKISEEKLTNIRINKAFDDKSRNLRIKHFPKFDINSKLINQLMKYATYEFKSDIISERIRQRFLYNNNNDD